MSYPAPVIFLPGIMGSTLRDEYPVGPENVWSVGKAVFKAYERITLHPDNPRYEVHEPARVARDQVFGLFYEEIIEELRYNLSPSPAEQVPVFPFAYDWRQPLVEIQELLAAFVDEVAERTSLLRHYHADGYRPETGKVSLVGHSMGGLVIAGYAKIHGLDRIDKVVTLASPFRGSIEAIAKTTVGGASFGASSGSSREREAARITPALYHLLPSYTGSVQPNSADLFDPTNWQNGIKETIAGFIERHSVNLTSTYPAQRRQEALAQAPVLLGNMLEEARTHRALIEDLSLADSKRWLAIVGVGAKTRQNVRLTVDPVEGPHFELPEPVNTWSEKNPTTRTGDETVPYHGARCAFVPAEEIVCLSPHDFEFLELGDKALAQLGFHGAIPSMNVAIRLTLSHLLGRKQGKIWGHPSPEINPRDWDPPIADLQ